MNRLLMLLFVFLALRVAGQEDPDKLFEQAREAAFNRKDYQEAERLALQVLQSHPDYHDVRIFYGRLQAWDNDYEAADEAFAYVLLKDPSNLDARLARIDALMWDDEYDDALEQANEGLTHHPANRELKLKKSKILIEKDDHDEAVAIVDELIKANRNDSAALQVLQDIYYSDLRFRVGAGYQIEIFDRPERPGYGPFHLGTVEIGNRFDWGSLIGKVNYANRSFSTAAAGNDLQLEVDAYPRIMRGLYLYLNGGYSPDRWIDDGNLFPRYRAGFEAFKSLPKSFELSAGFRYLNFNYGNKTDSDVWIYTASLGKYIGNYWINLRSYFRPNGNSWSHTEILYFRKYWGSNVSRFGLPFFGQNFVGFYIGKGSTPREPQFIEGDLSRLDSYKAGIELNKVVRNVWIVQLGASYEREQWNPRETSYWGNRFGFDVKVMKLFFKSRYKPQNRYGGL